MVAALGFGAVVIDGGMLYHTQSRLQSAADIAALAGARVLPSQGATAAIALATAVAAENGLSGSEIAVTVDLATQSVAVNARRTVNLGLARVLNRPQAEVGASAAAAAQSVAALRGAAPLGVVWRDFVFGQVYDLKVGGGSGEQGWYGALDLGGKGGGAEEYRRYLTHGWEGLLSVGDKVPLKTGNMSGPTEQAIRNRLDRCTHVPTCTHTQFAPNCPRLLIVPVVAPPQKRQVEVLGFAGFFIEGLPGSGNESFIRGRFVQFVVEGEAGTAGSYGARTFNLIR
jgi:acid phosphatase family membrane protein YuiD